MKPIRIDETMMELNLLVNRFAVAWGNVSSERTRITPETRMEATITSALSAISR